MEVCAQLKKFHMSPRKVRLLADLIRGKRIEEAQALLENQPRHAAQPLKKLLLSAIANWEQKKGSRPTAKNGTAMYLSRIYVNGAGMLKRIKPAPQGRAHRIRKRMSHITLCVKGGLATATPNN